MRFILNLNRSSVDRTRAYQYSQGWARGFFTESWRVQLWNTLAGNGYSFRTVQRMSAGAQRFDGQIKLAGEQLTPPQSSLSVSPYWREGCDGKEESEGERRPLFALPITPCSRRASYAKTTGDESGRAGLFCECRWWISVVGNHSVRRVTR